MAVQQRDGAWVDAATADQVVAAQAAGELDQYLGITRQGEPPADREALSEWLTKASPQQVVDAYAAGRLAPLL